MVNLINSKQLEYCLISVLGEEMLLDNITHVKSKIMCQKKGLKSLEKTQKVDIENFNEKIGNSKYCKN